jgi:hypothetical protein
MRHNLGFFGLIEGYCPTSRLPPDAAVEDVFFMRAPELT